MTASILFFPPGINSSAIMSQQAATFRTTAAGYFNNSRNHYFVGGTYDGMERHMADVNVALDQTLVDDSEGCDQSQPESSSSSVVQLYRHIRPTDDTAIDGYCTQSSDIAMESSNHEPTFPLEVLLRHIEDVRRPGCAWAGLRVRVRVLRVCACAPIIVVVCACAPALAPPCSTSTSLAPF